MRELMGTNSRTALGFVILILGSILGLGQSTRLGNGHHRVETFLLSALKDATKTKYEQAMQLLSRELIRLQVDWHRMDETEQDYFLADWMVEGYEQGNGRAEYGFLLSALGRINPRVRYRTAWRVFEGWGQLQPPQQAAAAPPELLNAMMVVCFALNRPELAIIICTCFAGLLRVREALHLRWRDVVFCPGCLTLCLGQTKTGMEQRVVLKHALLFQWIARYTAWQGRLQDEDLVFSMSYSSVLRWVKKLSLLLAGEELRLTTHSFRRSGASELSRQGVPIADICLFGRWLSDRSAREYIRKGEVAVLRSRTGVAAQYRDNWSKWASLIPHVWSLHKQLQQAGLPPLSHHRVTEASFRKLEDLVFTVFGLNSAE